VQKIELVELTEVVIAQLTPEGRETWEEMEQLALLGPPEKDRQSGLLRIWETGVPPEDEAALKALCLLRVGLVAEYLVEDDSRREAREIRRVSVIKAAQVMDHAEDRPVDPNMTVEQATVRLRWS
jgi:hypothetical protein